MQALSDQVELLKVMERFDIKLEKLPWYCSVAEKLLKLRLIASDA